MTLATTAAASKSAKAARTVKTPKADVATPPVADTLDVAASSMADVVARPAEPSTTHGDVFAWILKGLSFTHSDVIAAIDRAGLDKTVARELLPRNAFTRASKELDSNRIIRRLDEDETTVTFQFTSEVRNVDAFTYDKEAKLVLSKADGSITCDVPEIADAARDAMNTALGRRTANDVFHIIMRLFEKNDNDIFPIRPASGVYFVPARQAEFLDKIGALVSGLGGTPVRMPITRGTVSGDVSVRDAVATGLEALIKDHEDAIESFDTKTTTKSFETAAKRIQITRHKIESYAELLGSERERLLKVATDAKAKLRDRVKALAEAKADQFGEDEDAPPDA